MPGAHCVMTSLLELCLSARSFQLNRPALWVDGRTLTYSELRHVRSAACRRDPTSREVRLRRTAKFRCGLLVNRTPTAYAGVLASLMVGSAYVPLNPRFPSSRLRAMLAASAIDTLMVDHRSAVAAEPLLRTLRAA